MKGVVMEVATITVEHTHTPPEDPEDMRRSGEAAPEFSNLNGMKDDGVIHNNRTIIEKGHMANKNK
jgi:hypothetical protein